ncbi:MAG: hypothetical protein M3R44_05600 [Candidatus Eremiobacteraeota bacterium]|nr:hypothetical protein [Candidatus Eremiobacteraeota bacterium]
MNYDLDAEPMNVGLFYGDETTAPFFYAYIFRSRAAPRTRALRWRAHRGRTR